jgi:hypothetical protein
MATYFVFGNAPTIDELLTYTGIDNMSGELINIESTDDKSGHCIMKINGHVVGAKIDIPGVISAMYAVDDDSMGLRLLGILIEQWSEENSSGDSDIATTVIDDEVSLFLEYIKNEDSTQLGI